MIKSQTSRRRTHRIRRREFVCELCGEMIGHPSQVRLARPTNALPEETTLDEIHESCVSDFMKIHPGKWETYTLEDMEAKWLLSPLV